MRRYLHLSTGRDVDSTNLQVYSLEQAADRWNELVEDIREGRQFEADGQPIERLAFIVVCLGLSLSQLLGQNFSDSQKERIDSPELLLSACLKSVQIDAATMKYLNLTFGEFLLYYDAVRHFGKNKGYTKYRKLDGLTIMEVDRFRLMTIAIWDILLAHYRVDPANDIADFESIADEAVRFEPLPSPSPAMGS